MILMKGKIGYRSLEIEDLIERGLGSGDSLGERFHPRTYSLEGFFSSQSRFVLRVGLGGACFEICHEEVDLFTAEEFRDYAEAPFLERGGDCLEISHEYPFPINWNKPPPLVGTSISLTVRSGPILVPEGQKVIAQPFMAGDRF